MTNHRKTEAEQLRHRYLRKSAMRFAEDYAEYCYPIPFLQTFFINGMKIHIQAERVEGKDGKMPLEDQIADRSIDA